MKRALVLFAHGSRDPRWADPLQRLAERLRRRMPEHEVALAFLELMQPTLAGALGRLHAAGASEARVVPVFLAQGSHLKEDLPRLVEEAKAACPGLAVTVDRAIGEQDEVLESIARVIAGR